MAEAGRTYPARPILAVSAAIVRDRRVLLVKRARLPLAGLFTLPGGVVETGESLEAAVLREVREELGLDVAVVGLAGVREVIERDPHGRSARHFVILAFAARLLGGDLTPNDEIAEVRWVGLGELGALPTTEGLAPIVAEAFRLLAGHP